MGIRGNSTPCAVGWLQGGQINIIKKRKDSEGIIKIDKNHAIKVPDETKPRLIRLMKFLPFPPFIKYQWYPFYFADPEHALNLEITYQKETKPFTFTLRDKIEPIVLQKKEKFNLSEALSTQIKPSPPKKDKKGNIVQKYGLETMSAENLSTFLEGKQEAMLNRSTSDKLNMLMFILLGAIIGFLLGNVMPITSVTA